MMLGLDTSTSSISVAVYDPTSDRVVAERNDIGPMRHGEELIPTVASVLADVGVAGRELTAIVVGVGPGPYTGLRVGLVAARTLGLVWTLPVYGVCSLDPIAYAADLTGMVTADARRKELFWATYEEGERIDGPFVSRPADVPTHLLVAGAGPGLYPGHFEHVTGPVLPSAADMLRAVAEEAVELLDPDPIYLRRPDAVVPGPPKKVS